MGCCKNTTARVNFLTQSRLNRQSVLNLELIPGITTMLYSEKPADFNRNLIAVGCVVEAGGKILLLHRHSNRIYGNKWGFPTGKQEKGEMIEDTAVRELYEEAGIRIAPSAMHYCGKRYVRYPDQDFEYHLFFVRLRSQRQVSINEEEHQAFAWVTPSEALTMDFIEDLDGCLAMISP